MTPWITTELDYEGFPLMLRRPATVDRPRLQPLYPHLLSVTHKFSERKPNGLPDPGYNTGLIDFDLSIQQMFSGASDGVVVLIETYGGERNYYFYVVSEDSVSARLHEIRHSYPDENLEYDLRPDANWNFIDRYERDYF